MRTANPCLESFYRLYQTFIYRFILDGPCIDVGENVRIFMGHPQKSKSYIMLPSSTIMNERINKDKKIDHRQLVALVHPVL